jgi:transcriptional regulator with XRE-family HTH domain
MSTAMKANRARGGTAATTRQLTHDAQAGQDGRRRRAHLADFLRIRREALAPEEVGLAGGGRRRTPGLRREEVARIAGVGTTWYTWLEQGRDVRASRSVLEAIADALRMTAAERSHLIVLGRGEELANDRPPREQASPQLALLLEHLGSSAACVIGRRWDFLIWNDAYAAVFGDPNALPEDRRNLMWATFMDPARRTLFTDWMQGARQVVARFRADSARYVGDPEFEGLIEDVRQGSPEFNRWWRRHEVVRSGGGHKLLMHASVGEMAFEHAVFKLEEHPEQRLFLYTPLSEAETEQKVQRLLSARDS